MTGMESVRIAAVQYFSRPIDSFRDFAGQVESVIQEAARRQCRLVVFPEYYTLQLTGICPVASSMTEEVASVARWEAEHRDLLRGLAKAHDVYIIGGSLPVRRASKVQACSQVSAPTGEWWAQFKLCMTRREDEEWSMAPGEKLYIFQAEFGRFAVALCYDVEFPEICRAAARNGVEVLIVPSCTKDKRGFLRVRYCAQARAVEDQLYVVHACVVGQFPFRSGEYRAYGQSSILTPCDIGFPEDGILAEGSVGGEEIVVGDLDLGAIRRCRSEGTVLPLMHSGKFEGRAIPAEVVEMRK